MKTNWICLLGIMIGSVGFCIVLVLPQCGLANALNAGSEVLTGVGFYVLGQVVMYVCYFIVKIKALSSVATSVTLYQPTRCNISEDFNLKSLNVSCLFNRSQNFLFSWKYKVCYCHHESRQDHYPESAIYTQPLFYVIICFVKKWT
jgi:hypothetical protein